MRFEAAAHAATSLEKVGSSQLLTFLFIGLRRPVAMLDPF